MLSNRIESKGPAHRARAARAERRGQLYTDREECLLWLPADTAGPGAVDRGHGPAALGFPRADAFSRSPAGALVDRLVIDVDDQPGGRSCAQVLGGLVNSFGQFFGARVLLGIGEVPQFPASARAARAGSNEARDAVSRLASGTALPRWALLFRLLLTFALTFTGGGCS